MAKIGDRYVVVGEVDFSKFTEEEKDHIHKMGCVTPDGFLIVPESHYGNTIKMFPEMGEEIEP